MPKASKTGSFRKEAAKARQSPVKTVTQSITTNNQDPLEQSETVDQTTSDTTTTTTAAAELSRGQRKRQAKRQQYLKRQQLILSSLKLQHQEDQQKRIDGLDAMKDALLSTVQHNNKHDNDQEEDDTNATNTTKINLLKTNKSRQSLVHTESQQLNLVLQHPSFQQDPFAAIRQHLHNTLADDKTKHARQALQHHKLRQQQQAQKKIHKKEQTSRHKNKRRVRATRSKAK